MRSMRFTLSDIGPYCKISSEIPASVRITQTGIPKIISEVPEKSNPPKKNNSLRWQRALFDALIDAGYKPEWEWSGAIPGRRFRIDIAFPEVKLAIEVDGWQHHGKTLSAFKNDRKRQNLFVVSGWRVLRFFPGEISANLPGCVETVKSAILMSK